MNSLTNAGNEFIEWSSKWIRRFRLRKLPFTEAEKYGEWLLDAKKSWRLFPMKSVILSLNRGRTGNEGRLREGERRGEDETKRQRQGDEERWKKNLCSEANFTSQIPLCASRVLTLLRLSEKDKNTRRPMSDSSFSSSSHAYAWNSRTVRTFGI